MSRTSSRDGPTLVDVGLAYVDVVDDSKPWNHFYEGDYKDDSRKSQT